MTENETPETPEVAAEEMVTISAVALQQQNIMLAALSNAFSHLLGAVSEDGTKKDEGVIVFLNDAPFVVFHEASAGLIRLCTIDSETTYKPGDRVWVNNVDPTEAVEVSGVEIAAE